MLTGIDRGVEPGGLGPATTGGSLRMERLIRMQKKERRQVCRKCSHRTTKPPYANWPRSQQQTRTATNRTKTTNNCEANTVTQEYLLHDNKTSHIASKLRSSIRQALGEVRRSTGTAMISSKTAILAPLYITYSPLIRGLGSL